MVGICWSSIWIGRSLISPSGRKVEPEAVCIMTSVGFGIFLPILSRNSLDTRLTRAPVSTIRFTLRPRMVAILVGFPTVLAVGRHCLIWTVVGQVPFLSALITGNRLLALVRVRAFAVVISVVIVIASTVTGTRSPTIRAVSCLITLAGTLWPSLLEVKVGLQLYS